MEKIDLATNSKSIETTYEKVIRGDPNVTFAIFSSDKNVLKVGTTGSGGIEEFVEEFEDGKVQFGIVRVTAENSAVSKNLLVGWCPDGAPAKARLSFASNSAEVARVFNGYHVQVTARDQDDLDPEELLRKIGAAAGANYGGQGTAGKAAKPPTSKPQAAKPSTFVPPKPSLPKSTGKPVTQAPQEAKKPAVASEDDEWGGEKELEERDFQTQPLEDVPSAYQPTKVNMEELRKQKPDTVSSTPRENRKDTKTTEKEEGDTRPLSERMKAFDDNLSDGRLSSLPKPKTSHSVMSRFHPESSTESASVGTAAVKTAAFGAKPNFGSEQVDTKKDKLVGGTSRNFAAEGGKTPAQIWAEKRGKFTTVPLSGEPVRSDSDEVADKLASTSILEKISMVDKESNQKPISETKGADDSEKKPEETEPPAPEVPQRNFSQVKQAISEEQEKAPAPPAPPARNVSPSLPPRNQEKAFAEKEEVPPAPPARNNVPSLSEQNVARPGTQTESDPPEPSLPARDPQPKPASTNNLDNKDSAANEVSHKSSVSALAEYDYEKDEDNEIGFVEGDLIVAIEFADEEWWSGVNSRTGESGLFPATYVTLQGDSSNSANKTNEESHADAKDTKGASAVAEYDYEKDEDNELSFSEGDKIINIDFIDKDWWSGTLAKTGEVGLFPANYVTLSE